MKYEFHPEAELELYEAALRYEAEVSGLGVRFGDEVELVVGLLLEHPEMGSRVDENLRHFVLRKFPFSVVHAVVSELIYRPNAARCSGSRCRIAEGRCYPSYLLRPRVHSSGHGYADLSVLHRSGEGL